MDRIAIAAALWLLPVPLCAQWLNLPTPGIPRTADGKPDLTAPAPRTPYGKPDLSGIWRRPADKYYNNIAADLKPGEVQPWAEAQYQQRIADFGKDSMDTKCLPLGPAYSTVPYYESKIIQTPALLAILNNDLTYRQVFMDGRELEKDPNPSWMGYSVGRWAGDTLVVESSGFTERVWLDLDGHPHTEDLRISERYRRVDFGHMELLMTLTDSKAYTRPWTVAIQMELAADTELLEYVCNENEKARSHFDAAPGKYVKVSPDIFARYAGFYEIREGPKMRTVEISASGESLFWDMEGAGKQRLQAFSETAFYFSGAHIDFYADGQGAITHFVMMEVEGETKGVRRR